MRKSLALPVLLPLCLATTALAADFEGLLTSRITTVQPSRLVTMLGADATNADKVFAVPIERFTGLSGADTGVESKTATLQVKGSKVRVDVGDTGNYVIVDTDSSMIYLVMPKDKVVTEVSKADRERLNQQAAPMQKMMQEQLAKLPPEQRQKAEAMMGKVPAMAAPEVKAKALGKTQTVNGMTASAYETRSSDTVTLGWVTEENKNIARIYKAFQDSDKKLTIGGTGQEGVVERAFAAHGLPVRVQKLGPSGYRIQELTKVEKKALAADLFTTPAGYTKRSSSEPAGGGAGRK
jgi:hypothetical protein